MITVPNGQTFENGMCERTESGEAKNGIFIRAKNSPENLFVVAVLGGKELYVMHCAQILKDLGWTPPQ